MENKFSSLDDLLDYGDEYDYPDLIMDDYFRIDKSREKQSKQQNDNGSPNQEQSMESSDDDSQAQEEMNSEKQAGESAQEVDSDNQADKTEQEINSSEQDDELEQEFNSSEQDDEHEQEFNSDEQTSDSEQEFDSEEQTGDSEQEYDSEEQTGDSEQDIGSNEQTNDSQQEYDSNEQTDESEQEIDYDEQTDDSEKQDDESDKEFNSEEKDDESEQEFDSDEQTDDSDEQDDEVDKNSDSEKQDDNSKQDDESDKEFNSEEENDFDDLMDNYDEELNKKDTDEDKEKELSSPSNKLNDVTPTKVYKIFKKLVSLSYERYQKGTYRYNKKEIIKHYLTSQKFRIIDDLVSPTFKPDVFVFDLSPSNDNSLEMYVNAISSVAVKDSIIYLTFNSEVLKKLIIKKNCHKSINVQDVANSSLKKYASFDCVSFEKYQSLYAELRKIKDRKIYVFSDFDVSIDMEKLSQENKDIVWFSTENNHGMYSFYREYPSNYVGYYVETTDIKDIEKFVYEKNKEKYRGRSHNG